MVQLAVCMRRSGGLVGCLYGDKMRSTVPFVWGVKVDNFAVCMETKGGILCWGVKVDNLAVCVMR